jgi:hypothetical protein
MPTLAIIKRILQIDNTDYDDYINVMLPIVDGLVKRYTNQTFLRSDGTECYPQGIELAYATFINHYMEGIGLTTKACGGGIVKTYQTKDQLMDAELNVFKII